MYRDDIITHGRIVSGLSQIIKYALSLHMVYSELAKQPNGN